MLRVFCAVSWILLFCGGAALADTPIPPPSTWLLQQNAPNPFCSATEVATFILFQSPQSARVELLVLSPDGNTTVRTLVDQILAAGYFTIPWDGKDSNGAALDPGFYPYRLTARNDAGDLLFQDTKIADLSCAVSTSSVTWAVLKSLYRD